MSSWRGQRDTDGIDGFRGAALLTGEWPMTLRQISSARGRWRGPSQRRIARA
jgi:hypothetical protein